MQISHGAATDGETMAETLHGRVGQSGESFGSASKLGQSSGAVVGLGLDGFFVGRGVGELSTMR